MRGALAEIARPPRWHIPALCKPVVRGQRSAWATMRQRAGPRERRHLPGALEVGLIDAGQKCPFSGKAWSFYRAIVAPTGRRLGSPDALKSPSTAIMCRRTDGEIIPGISIHTCPLIFRRQREFVRGSFHLHSSVCNRRRKEGENA